MKYSETVRERKALDENSSQDTLKMKESKPFSSFQKQQAQMPEWKPAVNCHFCLSCQQDKLRRRKSKSKKKETMFSKESNLIDLNQINEKEAKGVLQYH